MLGFAIPGHYIRLKWNVLTCLSRIIELNFEIVGGMVRHYRRPIN